MMQTSRMGGGSGMSPPRRMVSSLSINNNTITRQLSAESTQQQWLTLTEQEEKERFLMFMRVLMKYLEQRDTNMHVKAKATIKECYEKNKSGDPAFRSLTNSMYTRLRQTVGEVYWKKAQDYLDHFLKQMMTTKEKRLASGGLGRQSTTTITATSEQKTTMEKKKVETDKLEAEKKKKRNAANRKRRAEQKKNKEEEKINQLIASKDKEITEKDKEIAILKESLEISKQIGAVELSDEEIAILQDAVETVDMTNDELEPASKRPRTEDTPMKSLAGILLEETGKKVVKVKQEQMETRADLEDVRDDLDIANETVTQQAVFTDAWQSKFDELAAIAQAAGVDGKIISEIRNRSITNGSS